MKNDDTAPSDVRRLYISGESAGSRKWKKTTIADLEFEFAPEKPISFGGIWQRYSVTLSLLHAMRHDGCLRCVSFGKYYWTSLPIFIDAYTRFTGNSPKKKRKKKHGQT